MYVQLDKNCCKNMPNAGTECERERGRPKKQAHSVRMYEAATRDGNQLCLVLPYSPLPRSTYPCSPSCCLWQTTFISAVAETINMRRERNMNCFFADFFSF